MNRLLAVGGHSAHDKNTLEIFHIRTSHIEFIQPQKFETSKLTCNSSRNSKLKRLSSLARHKLTPEESCIHTN